MDFLALVAYRHFLERVFLASTNNNQRVSSLLQDNQNLTPLGASESGGDNHLNYPGESGSGSTSLEPIDLKVCKRPPTTTSCVGDQSEYPPTFKISTCPSPMVL